MSLSLSIENGTDRRIAASSVPGDETILVYDEEYRVGDAVLLSGALANRFVVLQFDDALATTLTYFTADEFRFPVPFAENRVCYSPRAFTGKAHLLFARYATPAEISQYRNLSLNTHDMHGVAASYPHASANVETRGESVFAARNAIDGIKASSYHGEWPYTSWGINRDPQACLTVEFGRPVRIDRAVLYLRTDFPHDAWWKSATLRVSDGSSIVVPLEKRAGPQGIDFPGRVAEWIRLDTLIKADDPSPFPALTQLEIWGTES
jgi:hypothetical protein